MEYTKVFRSVPIKPSTPIIGYKPKYTQEQSKPVTDNQPEELTPEEELTKPIPFSSVSRSPKGKMSGKTEMKSTMLPIYEKVLVEHGLNPAFAKALVAQDALESSWGKRIAADFNYGGIKGKGMSQRSPEYINGRMQSVTSSFRNFSSPEEYARYKVRLLNNSRYNAFSGNVSEFATRVKRGGYATDPDYVSKLNNMIKSARRGMRFDPAPEVEAVKEEYVDLLNKRKDILRDNELMYGLIPFSSSVVADARSHVVRGTPMYIDPTISSNGYYTWPFYKTVLRENNPSHAMHEVAHSSWPKARERAVEHYIDVAGDELLTNPYYEKSKYLDSGEEVYARLSQLRKFLKDEYGYDYNHKFTLDEINKIYNDAIKYWERVSTYEDKDGNQKTSSFVMDNNGKVTIGLNPTIPENFVLRSQENTPIFRHDNTFGIIGRYPAHLLWMLLNNVA